MHRRPRVLVAIQPALLADLVRGALPPDFDIVVQPVTRAGWCRWDVAVVPSSAHAGVRARHVVSMAPGCDGADRTEPHLTVPDFRSLVALVRRLCEVRPAG